MHLNPIFINFQIFYTDCSNPPEGLFVAWEEQFSYVRGEFWSGTKVKYTCSSKHSLKWGETDLLTCGHDGKWDYENAPLCAPRKCSFINFQGYILEFSITSNFRTFFSISIETSLYFLTIYFY